MDKLSVNILNEILGKLENFIILKLTFFRSRNNIENQEIILQVIQLGKLSRVMSQTQTEAINLNVSDGISIMSAKIITPILQSMNFYLIFRND